jgi:hypothetical protein
MSVQNLFGVCFRLVDGGYAIAPTTRLDLHMDRMQAQADHRAVVTAAIARGALRPQAVPDPRAIIITATARAAGIVSNVLNQFWRSHGRVTKAGVVVVGPADIALSLSICRREWKLETILAEDVAPATASAVGEDHKPYVLGFEPVPDPSMTDAEYWHQLAASDDGIEISTVTAAVNMSTLIGGLARFPRRKETHEEAARKYRASYERATGMGPRATNYGNAVQVDFARAPLSMLMPDGDGHAYKMASRALGILRSAVVDPIVLYDMPVSEVARKRYHSDGGQARKKVGIELKAGLDILAAHFGLLGSPSGSAKVTGWLESRPPLDLPKETAAQ